jgi:hypothetical protein
VSKHRLEIKGFGVSISATGVTAIVAAVIIVVLVAWMPRPF